MQYRAVIAYTIYDFVIYVAYIPGILERINVFIIKKRQQRSYRKKRDVWRWRGERERVHGLRFGWRSGEGVEKSRVRMGGGGAGQRESDEGG